jgi:hypothetical protein
MEKLGIWQWCRQIRQGIRSRYVRLLEAEIARERAEVERLRTENRAMLNSLLGTAGVAPIEAPPPHPAQIAPIRRRSWSQIAAAREIAAGREGIVRDRGERRQAGA